MNLTYSAARVQRSQLDLEPISLPLLPSSSYDDGVVAAQLIRIGVVSLSRIIDDPRVRRQCEVLQANGFEVLAIGQHDELYDDVSWTVVQRSPEKSIRDSQNAEQAKQIFRATLKRIARSLFRLTKNILKRIAGDSLWRFVWLSASVIRGQRCRLQPQYAERVFWSWNSGIHDLYEKAKSLQCDIWLANDWITLPIAARLAAENGGIYVYDTHEFALEEYHERLVWRLAQRPIVAALERAHINRAKLVTAVSSGIADRLTEIYQLPRAAVPVRNTPSYVEVPFRATPAMVRVLYHGIVAPGRGLEAAIDSVPSWAPDRQLYVRGPASEDYLASLRRRIEDAGLQSRVFLIPAVPMTALVTAAAEFDIGFFALPGHSLHNEYALPNKFFEYAMAGLALCVSDLPEMSSILNRYQLGSTFAKVTPELIASAINEFSRETIDCFKKNSLIAARELCWEAESNNFVSALTALVKTKA
jgi:glycosyltransferase involved in cell wall biosynthesis